MPVFIQNKYTTWYYSIIENAKTRVLLEGTYTESHHIIPASFYKNHNRSCRPGWLDGKHDAIDNLVDLTAREHFVCHWLLTKITDGEANVKMFRAFHATTLLSENHDVKITSRTYEIIRNKVSEHMINNNPMHNLTPDEHAARSAKLSVSVKKSWELRDRDGMGEHLKQVWVDKTEEELKAHSDKVIEALAKLTPEQKEEAKRKRLEAVGKWEPITCPHCNIISKSAVNMRRYHFDNCLKHPTPKPRKEIPRTPCKHCGVMVTNNVMAISHGDKCKHKPVG